MNKTSSFYQGLSQTLSGRRGQTWLLTDIVDGTITSASSVRAHGHIEKWQGGLKLDGHTAWIEVNYTNGESARAGI